MIYLHLQQSFLLASHSPLLNSSVLTIFRPHRHSAHRLQAHRRLKTSSSPPPSSMIFFPILIIIKASTPFLIRRDQETWILASETSLIVGTGSYSWSLSPTYLIITTNILTNLPHQHTSSSTPIIKASTPPLLGRDKRLDTG